MNLNFMTPGEVDGRIRVLLVDDMKSLLIIMERGLRSQGRVVHAAESEGEPPEILEKNPNDLTVRNMAMYELGRLEMGRVMRTISEGQVIRKSPFLLFAGWREFCRGKARDLIAMCGPSGNTGEVSPNRS